MGSPTSARQRPHPRSHPRADTKDLDAAAVRAENSDAYLALQARNPEDVRTFAHLLDKTYVKQART